MDTRLGSTRRVSAGLPASVDLLRMSSRQCLGTTKKGTRCLLTVKEGKMCHHHVGQKVDESLWRNTMSKVSQPLSPIKLIPKSKPIPLKVPKAPKPIDYSKPGYIYVYTLASIMDKNLKSNGWLKTRNFPGAKDKDKWVAFDSRKNLLVKVGMTTKTVAKRILQWEAKCHHKLVCLHPNHPGNSPPSLIDQFMRLTLNRTPNAQFRAYTTFQNNSNGFFVSRDVMRAEQEVHGILAEKFGRGDLYCTGCVEKGKHEHKESSLLKLFKKRDFLESDYNVHVEWFAVPRDKLHEVYKVIDGVCMRYLP